MAISPRIVTEDRHITWDGVTQRLPKGQVMDVPPGSALEREIGKQYLVPLPGAVAQEPAAAVAQGGGGGPASALEVTEASPPKSRVVGRKPDAEDAKDGDA